VAALCAVVLSVVGTVGLAAGAFAQPQTCAGVEVTIAGTDGNNKLTGTEGPDVIHAGKGDDKIFGLGGDDVLCGGEGADKLSGGAGDDHIEGNRDGIVVAHNDYTVAEEDTLNGGPGDDYLDGGVDDRHASVVYPTTLTYADSESGVVVDLELGQATGDGTDTIVGPVGKLLGSAHVDELRGTAGDEYLVGNAGADLLDGRGGADQLEAADLYRVHPEISPTTLIGGSGLDQLVGSDGNDILRGGAGNDVFQARLVLTNCSVGLAMITLTTLSLRVPGHNSWTADREITTN
jgi:Ca2+-binding RTX toxin-like protein